NAKFDRGFEHRQVLRRSLADDAGPQLIRDSNLPRCPWRDLLAGNETIGQPAMNAGRVHAQNLRRFPNRNEFACRRLRGWLESRNVAIAPEAADLVGGEALPGGRLTSLTIQNPSYDFVGIEGRETSE